MLVFLTLKNLKDLYIIDYQISWFLMGYLSRVIKMTTYK